MKKSKIWSYSITVPKDGSEPTCTFTPWAELPRGERIRRVIGSLITIGMVFYSMFKMVEWITLMAYKITDTIFGVAGRVRDALDEYEAAHFTESEDDGLSAPIEDSHDFDNLAGEIE